MPSLPPEASDTQRDALPRSVMIRGRRLAPLLEALNES